MEPKKTESVEPTQEVPLGAAMRRQAADENRMVLIVARRAKEWCRMGRLRGSEIVW